MFKGKKTTKELLGKRVGIMFYFKGCVKCKGDLFLEKDFYGSYLKCLQCGRLTEVETRETGVKVTRAQRLKKIAA